MRHSFALSLALLTLAAPGSAPAQELSQEDARARTHFDAGRLHYEEGAYDRALVEFQRAWELSHRTVLLVNLATTQERLGMYEEAARNLREYLRLSPDEPERARLERRIENLDRLRQERARAGTTEPPGSSAPAAPAPGPDGGLLGGAIAALAVGGAGGVLMGVFGALALDADAQLAAGCGASGTCTDEQVADANTFALVSDVSLGVLLAGATAGTVLLVLALTSSGGGSAERALVAPWLSPDGAGVSTRVRF